MKKDTFILIGALIIIIVGFIIYTNSVDSSFHLDDYTNIVYNDDIKDITATKSWWNYSTNRPVSMFSFALNYHFNELDVKYYHLVNIIIHIINSILVFWLIRLIISSPLLNNIAIKRDKNMLALFVSLLFLTHPLATQSVTYIIQRQNLLAALFYLISLSFYFKARFRTDRLKFLYFA